MIITEIENGVLLKSGTTWQSWGEQIKNILKSDNNSVYEYQLTSIPKLKTTILDYGKNIESINQFERLLKNIAQ